MERQHVYGDCGASPPFQAKVSLAAAFRLRNAVEAISKPQIAFEGKAKADENAAYTGVCEHFEEAFNTAIER